MDTAFQAVHMLCVSGRFFLKFPEGMLAQEFAAPLENSLSTKHGRVPRYNISPPHDLAIVRLGARNARCLSRARWGLIPSHAKDGNSAWRCINAPAESLDVSPVFRTAFTRRRCLIPAHGFYEWSVVGRRRFPHAITLKTAELFTFAGLWDEWLDPETDTLVRTCTIVTTRANDVVAKYFHRMPVILPAEARSAWLGEQGLPGAALAALLAPYPAALMTSWPVTPAVNRPEYDRPSNILRWEPRKP